MRAKSLFSLLFVLAGLQAIGSTGTRCRVPGSELTFLVDAEIKEEGDALKDLDEDARELLQDAKEFSFATRDGVTASIMRYQPKEEYFGVTKEWGRVIADGIESVAGDEATIQSREVGRFGDLDGHLISMSLKAGTITAKADFVVIAGKKEILLLALTSSSNDEKAVQSQRAILDSLEYGELKFTDRKPVRSLDTQDRD